jgi:hypothetical protein
MPDTLNLQAATIPAEVLDKIKRHMTSAINLIKPFAIMRSPGERDDMIELGEMSLEFIERARKLAIQNPQLRPDYFEMAEINTNAADSHVLWVILKLAEQFHETVKEAGIVAGSEAYQAAFWFYCSAKYAAMQGEDGAKAVYDELKKYIPRGRRRAPPLEVVE